MPEETDWRSMAEKLRFYEPGYHLRSGLPMRDLKKARAEVAAQVKAILRKAGRGLPRETRGRDEVARITEVLSLLRNPAR